MNKNYLVWGGVVVVALLVGYYLVKGQSKPYDDTQDQTVTQPSPTAVLVTQATTSGEMMSKDTVSYTDSGFAPKSITVKVGTPVTWMNMSKNKSLWVASAVHPTHQVYPEFDQKESVENGGSYSFTFTKVGSWKYHNHKVPSDGGTVVVQ